MRKLKKINGFLVVKFNERELRAWEGTALGLYGVIDAEMYTGSLDVDRSVMEYDGAETLEEAIEQARGLESEQDIVDEPLSVSVVIEREESIREHEVNPQAMLEDYKKDLASQIKSHHYPSVNATTARHALYGFELALERLGLIDEDDCIVTPDTFAPERRDDFRHSMEDASTRQIYALGLALMEVCPQNDCIIYRNTFRMCLELDEQIDRVDGLSKRILERELFRYQNELFQSYLCNYAIQCYRKEQRAKAKEPPDNRTAPTEAYSKDGAFSPWDKCIERSFQRTKNAIAPDVKAKLLEMFEPGFSCNVSVRIDAEKESVSEKELRRFGKLMQELDDYINSPAPDHTSQ